MDGGVGTDFMRFLLMRCSCPKWSLRAVKDWPPDLWASRSRWFSARSESLSFFRLPISWRTRNEERTRQDMAIRTGIRRVKKVRPGVADAIVHEVIFKREHDYHHVYDVYRSTYRLEDEQLVPSLLKFALEVPGDTQEDT